MLSFIARGASMSQPNRYIYIMYIYIMQLLYVYMSELSFIARGASMSQPNRYII